MSDVVFPEELSYFVLSLRPFQLHEVGLDKWLDCHEMIIKLSQQATLEAAEHREEAVKEFLVAKDKLKVLIHEAYCILLWKTKILPYLIEVNPNPQATFLIYTVLFHEGAVISLLESALFHQSGCESLQEAAVDLIDYCAQAVAQTIGLVSMGFHENESNIDVDEAVLTELERQKRDLIYKIGLRCISILSYLAENASALPLSAARRMVNTHDLPWLLVDLLHFRPWHRSTKKGIQKFIDDKWTNVSGDNLLKVVQHEAQTWFCLRQLLFNNSLMQSYDLNDCRRQQLAKCAGFLHETILDQLPPLVELKQYLCQLNVTSNLSVGADHKEKQKINLLLEEIPQIKENIIQEAQTNGGFLEIAQNQEKLFLTPQQEQIHEIALRLTKTYNTEFLAAMEDKATTDVSEKAEGKNVCGNCSDSAEKKCSKCKLVFYCSRECQLKDWPLHKEHCVDTALV